MSTATVTRPHPGRIGRDALLVGLALLAAGNAAQSLRGVSRRAGWTGRVFLYSALGLALATGAHAATQPPAFHVQITGHGRPLILIPGFDSSGPGTWDGTVAQFKDHYRCYVLTLAGFAGEPPIQAPLLPAVRKQLAAYIEQNHLDHPVLVGHSLGGNVVLDFAAHYPRLAGPLVVVDSLPFYAGAWLQIPNLAAGKPIISRIVAGMDQITPAEWFARVKTGGSTNFMVTSPANQRMLIGWASASDFRTSIEISKALFSLDQRAELPRIASPLLVLGTWIGLHEAYHISRADCIRAFQRQYAGARHLTFVMSDNARHFIMLDQPAWFYAHLRSFLAAHPE